MQRQGDIKSGYQWTGGLALHEVLQDLGMRVRRAWVRAHGSWGWRGAGQGGCCEEEQSMNRARKLWLSGNTFFGGREL